MAGKKFNPDNLWSELSRLSVSKKDGEEPRVDAGSKGSTGKPAVVESTESAGTEKVLATATGKVVTAKVLDDGVGTDEEGAEVEENEEIVQYTMDELQVMSLKELQEIAKEAGVKIKGLTKQELIDAIAEETDLVIEADEEVLLSEDEALEDEEVDGEMSLEEALKLLGEDGETEEDFSDAEFEVVEEEVLEGDVNFEADGNN